MTVQIFANNKQITYETIKFSDGSSNIKIDPNQDWENICYVNLTLLPITNMDSALWELILVIQAIVYTKEQSVGNDNFYFTLHLPYLPHGRADRIFEKGNPRPLEAFLSILSLSVNRVVFTDPHSDAYLNFECMSNVDIEVKPQHECFIETMHTVRGWLLQAGDVLVSPDKGAYPKVLKLVNQWPEFHFETLCANKKRDIHSGKVIETEIPLTDLTGKTCWIVDDICDGGGTFIPLAKKLKEMGASKVMLYVTHGIFAKGLALFKPDIDCIYCYQIVGTYVNHQDITNFNLGLETK